MKFAFALLFIVLGVSHGVKEACPEGLRWCVDECVGMNEVCPPYTVPIKYLVDHHGCELTKAEVWCVDRQECLTLYNNYCATPKCELPHVFCEYKQVCVTEGFGESCPRVN